MTAEEKSNDNEVAQPKPGGTSPVIVPSDNFFIKIWRPLQKAWQLLQTSEGKILASAAGFIVASIVIPIYAYKLSKAEYNLNVQIATSEAGQRIMTATAWDFLQTVSAPETATAKAEFATQNAAAVMRQTQEAQSAATTKSSLLKLTVKYMCTNVADFARAPNAMEIAAYFSQVHDIDSATMFQTPYLKRMPVDAQNHVYLFIVLINEGDVDVDLTDYSDAIWNPSSWEPVGWIDKDTLVGIGRLSPKEMFALLVDDHEVASPLNSISTSPPNYGEPSLTESYSIPFSVNTLPILRCNDFPGWKVESIVMNISYQPIKDYPSGLLHISMSGTSDSISEFAISGP